jgi:hypothetical protein
MVGASRRQLESFADQFYGAWKWIGQPDGSQLTGEARKLKRKLMSMVASVQYTSLLEQRGLLRPLS